MNAFRIGVRCDLALQDLQMEQVTGQLVCLAVPHRCLFNHALGYLHVWLKKGINAVQLLEHVHIVCPLQITGH